MLATVACLCAPVATAQTYPAKPVTIIVPHPAGGTSDILARTMAGELTREFKRQVNVENRAGGNGLIAAQAVARAAPDGYTLLLATASTHAVNPWLYRSVPYDAIKDFAPVVLFATVPNALVIAPQVKAMDVKELIGWIQGRKGGANMGSAGSGTPGHLAGEMFKDAVKLDFQHVPYKGGSPALTDLLAGQIDFLFTTIPGALSHIKSGKLRALAVTSPERSSALPEVATMREAGLKDFAAVSWHGLVAPAGTPKSVIDALYNASAKALATHEVKTRLGDEGAAASGMPPEKFAAFIGEQLESWGRAVKLSGAKAD
ncbi:MAG: tripartite tricarboxylate transporter substrate binding protein [Betaproteobacteria bacterium]|nr:tripartite tricarboxylate transporter substrate binding protein [Betaproteobacteria bacterium]